MSHDFHCCHQSSPALPTLACKPENRPASSQKHRGLQREQNDRAGFMTSRPVQEGAHGPGLRLQRNFPGDELGLALAHAQFHNHVHVATAGLHIAEIILSRTRLRPGENLYRPFANRKLEISVLVRSHIAIRLAVAVDTDLRAGHRFVIGIQYLAGEGRSAVLSLKGDN